MIFIKTEENIAGMRRAGRVVAGALELAERSIKAGLTTLELNNMLEDFVLSHNAIPSFKGYNGYKFCTCLSVNSTVVHGLPSGYALKVGDIIGVDIAVIVDGWHSDAARTFGVEKISGQNQKLIDAAKDCFFEGIKYATPEYQIGDMAAAIQHVAESRGYSVVKDLIGHGIGKKLHEDPAVPNYGQKGTGVKLKTGMALAVEPMINIGTYQVEIDQKDGWTCRTKDGSNSAHYENTIIVRDGEAEILTLY